MSLTVQYARRRLNRIDAALRIDDLGTDEFAGYASVFGVADGAGDVVARGAFRASLRKRPAADVRLLYQHLATEPIGIWQEIREDSHGLFVRGRLICDVARGREVMALIRAGAISGLSIGFRTVRATRDPLTRHRILTEIELWEISVVTFPLSPQSQVVAVGKTLAAQILDASRQMATTAHS